MSRFLYLFHLYLAFSPPEKILNCNFQVNYIKSEPLYECVVENYSGYRNITKVNGTHIPYYSNIDIESLVFSGSDDIFELPQNLGDFFPNLINFDVSHAELVKIDSFALKTTPKLQYLTLDDVLVQSIPGYLFKYTPNLKEVLIRSSELKYVNDHAFDNVESTIELSGKCTDDKTMQINPTFFQESLREVLIACTEDDKVYCDYAIDSNGRYQCHLVQYKKNYLEKRDAIGLQAPGKTNDDVAAVLINKFSSLMFPLDLANIFPNLRSISMSPKDENDGILTMGVTADHLKNFPLLEELDLQDQDIPYLESNTFMNSKNIKRINFNRNADLLIIGFGVFLNLENLTYVQVSTGASFHIEAKTHEEVLNTPNLLNEKYSAGINHDVIRCEYGEKFLQFVEKVYYCRSTNLEGVKQREKPSYPIFRKIFFAFGNHLVHKNESDVKAFETRGMTVSIFPVDLQKVFENLQSIEMIKANMQYIPIDGLVNLTGLVRLDLSNNVLCSITSKIFMKNHKLTYLNLEYNNLLIITVEVFNEKTNLAFINLAENGCIDEEISYPDEIPKLIEDIEISCQGSNSSNCDQDYINNYVLYVPKATLGETITMVFDLHITNNWKVRFTIKLIVLQVPEVIKTLDFNNFMDDNVIC